MPTNKVKKETIFTENLTEDQLKELADNTDLCRELAFMQYNNEPYFIYNGKFYRGEEYESDEELDEIEGFDEEEHENHLILTDEEADEKAEEYIKDSVWAFNAEFIVDHSGLPYEAVEMVKGYQEKCESANETLTALITDFDEFVSDAISADGRGHFISFYDGEENEETVEIYPSYDSGNPTFYIYRMN